jgi:hypothetical protein
MTSVHPGPGPTDPRPTSDRPVSLVERILYPEWGPIVAGGIAAAALALVLHAFALAIGLSVSSAAPTWRDASFAIVLLSALYVVLAALASYGLGGYLTGLMRTRPSSREDADLGDGLHGLRRRSPVWLCLRERRDRRSQMRDPWHGSNWSMCTSVIFASVKTSSSSRFQ